LGKKVRERVCGGPISDEETMSHILALLFDGLITPKKGEVKLQPPNYQLDNRPKPRKRLLAEVAISRSMANAWPDF
jgi:hypothetical protein